VTAGGATALPTETARLSPTELAAGMHLACQVTLRGDMGVEVPDDVLGAESFDCTVRSVRALTPLMREVILQMPEGQRPAIVAGSFVQVTAPPYTLDFAGVPVPEAHASVWAPLRMLAVKSTHPVTRAYSVSNRPADSNAGRLVLNIRLALPPPSVPEAQPGIVSSWLFTRKPGAVVPVAGPFGTFRAQPGAREMVLIGGGVGIAPLRAIVFDQLERQQTVRKIGFWYGARSAAELCYGDEMADLATRHTNFRWTVALSDPAPDDGWTGPTGFVHTIALDYLREHPAPETCEYYLCGPPLMIRAVLAMLDDLGVERDSIYNDDFGV
jgi:Na+-transporting NADH:ubiquinone oxidoreductase subunit F